MQFIQVGMLGALGALAIPVIIHLLFRQRPRTVELGTIQFLKIVLRDNAKRRRIRRWLLLALRLACVALIAFVFARPFLLATEEIEGDRLVIGLIDRSASMGLQGGNRPIDRAGAGAKALAARAGQGTRLELAVFDAAVHPLKPAALNVGFEPSNSGTDYDSAMAWARDLCVRSRQQSKEIHIFTDLQRAGLGRGEVVNLPSDVAVRLVDLGRAFPKNVAVTNLTTATATIRPGDKATVTASVFNASPLPARQVPVRLHLESDGKTHELEKTIDLDGGATSTVVFALPALAEGLWRGHVEATIGDGLPFDDRRYLALDVAPPTRVVLIDGDAGKSPYESETYFLQAALRLAAAGQRYAKSPFDPRVVNLGEGESLPDLAKAHVVVLANVGSLSAADAARLAGFVDRGGGLLVFTGSRVLSDGAASLIAAGLGVGEVAGSERALETPWRLDRWEAEHPVFRPFRNPEHGDLRRPAFTAITRIKPDPKARVLAQFRGGVPALLERDLGRGKVLWFTSACDRAWGDWPRGRMYVPMVHQMVAYVSGLTEGGRVRPALASDDRKPGLIDDGGILRVVNVDPFESETARCTPREFAGRYGFTLPVGGSDSVATAKAARSKSDDRMRGDEIWPWLALALIGGLFLENFLANRTAA